MTDTVERSVRRMAEVLAAHKVVHTDHAARILTCACGASLEFAGHGEPDVMDAHRARALSAAGIGWPGALSDSYFPALNDATGLPPDECWVSPRAGRAAMCEAFGAREEAERG